MRTSDAQAIMDKLSMMTNVSSSVKNKRSVCRYNYYIDIDDNNSFWIGFEPNWLKFNSEVKYGRIEFNPAKVSELLEFQSIYGMVKYSVAKNFVYPVRFDLAIDIPVSREKVHLIKDNRLYEEYSLSSSNRTQYLGRRNTHGRVKVYNKALELKLENIDLTRVELTVDYQSRDYAEVNSLLPKMYILDSFQFPMGVNGSDKLILMSVMSDMSLIKELPQVKRKKIEGYLQHTLLSLELDNKKYNYVLDYINTFIN